VSAKRRGSSKRRSIPKLTRWREKARRMVKGLTADLRGRSTYTRKASSGDTETAKRTPWPPCTSCDRPYPAQSYLCSEPTHRGMCVSCCGYPHHDEDDETHETAGQGLARDKDDEDKEDDDNDHHH
jgi:hypothetical protein